MKKLLLLIALPLLFSSCLKKDCEKLNYGTLVLINHTNEPIEFYFDNVYMYNINSLETETLEIDVGTHRFGGKHYGSTFADTLTWDEVIDIGLCTEQEYTFQ